MDNAIWTKIIEDLKTNPRDLQTIPIINRNGRWFYARADGNIIIIERAKNHTSKITGTYLINKTDFDVLYPIYLRRKKGEPVSKEATEASRNQVYIYSILHNCGGV